MCLKRPRADYQYLENNLPPLPTLTTAPCGTHDETPPCGKKFDAHRAEHMIRPRRAEHMIRPRRAEHMIRPRRAEKNLMLTARNT